MSPTASAPYGSILTGGKKDFPADPPAHKYNALRRFLTLFGSHEGKIAVLSFVIGLKTLKETLKSLFSKQKPETLQRKLNTRFVGYLIENCSVLTITYLRHLLPLPSTVEQIDENGERIPLSKQVKVIARNILIALVSCLIAEEGTMLLLHLVNTRIFNFVPYFHGKSPNQVTSPFTLRGFRDWLSGNAYLQVFGGGIALGLIESFTPKEWADEVNNERFQPLRFLRNFVIFRVVVDVMFYLGHRTMHIPAIYKILHKKHHEHFITNLSSNYHFTASDLFIESALPMFSAMVCLRALGTKMGRFELYLMMDYLAWYELGSHVGKPLKIISMFPPLSIIYNRILNLDDGAIRFHERHHNLRHCNYGITSWIDYLLGTVI